MTQVSRKRGIVITLVNVENAKESVKRSADPNQKEGTTATNLSWPEHTNELQSKPNSFCATKK